MTLEQAKPFGVNAEQKYLLHLQNIIQVQDIYSLVDAKNEYVDLLADRQIEEVIGWGCRLLFTKPKKGIDTEMDMSVHNPQSGFERTNTIAYVDIPCKIDRTYYYSFTPNYWVDAIGSDEGVLKMETQMKNNMSSALAQDINDEVEDTLADKANYRPNTSKDMRKLIDGEDRFDGNMITLDKGKFDVSIIIGFLWHLSSQFKSPNRIFQKGYYADLTRGRDEADAYEQLPTNTPELKGIGIICDSLLVNRLATEKLADTINTRYIDMKERFAYVKETNFKNVLKKGKKHRDWKGYWDKDDKKPGTDKWQDVYENEKLLCWIGDVRVPVLKIREPREGLKFKEEVENGTRWFFLKSRVYVGLATCLNYFGIFLKTAEYTET